MDKKLIEQWALENGFTGSWFNGLERFAALVAAHEREQCALVCEERGGTMSMFASVKDANRHNAVINGCAAAIRARGELSQFIPA